MCSVGEYLGAVRECMHRLVGFFPSDMSREGALRRWITAVLNVRLPFSVVLCWSVVCLIGVESRICDSMVYLFEDGCCRISDSLLMLTLEEGVNRPEILW